MKPDLFIFWLYNYLKTSRDSNKNNLERVLEIKEKINTVITNGEQLEIPFPDDQYKVITKTDWVSNSTYDTYTTFTYDFSQY